MINTLSSADIAFIMSSSHAIVIQIFIVTLMYGNTITFSSVLFNHVISSRYLS